MPLALVLAAIALQSPAWIEPTAIRIQGYDRVQGSREKNFEILRVGNDLSVEAVEGVDGVLSGLRRIEMRTNPGTVTWLAASPKYGIHLPGLSNDEWNTITRSPRFSKKDLAERPELVARLLGKLIYQKPDEAVAAQDCFVLRLTAGSSVQNLWLDKRTGILLRQEDTDGQNVYFTRRIELVQYNPEVGANAFSLPQNMKVFRGLPSPEILLFLDIPKSDRQIEQEIQKLKGQASLSAAWIKTPPAVPGYRYVSTNYRESKQIPSTPRVTNPFAAPELQPGGLPEGWTVSGRVDPLKNTIDIQFDSAGSKPRILTAIPTNGSPSAFGLNVDGVSIEFVAYLAPDGSLVISPGTDAKAAEEARRFRKENAGGSSARLQSDFALDETGDTVSFVQVRNRPLSSALRGIVLPPAQKRGKFDTWQLSLPIKLNIVSWQDANGTYAFWSSAMSIEELSDLATKVR